MLDHMRYQESKTVESDACVSQRSEIKGKGKETDPITGTSKNSLVIKVLIAPLASSLKIIAIALTRITAGR